MRISGHEQARRLAMALAKVDIGEVVAKRDLSDLEYVTVLSDLLAGMLNRMANTEIREHDEGPLVAADSAPLEGEPSCAECGHHVLDHDSAGARCSIGDCGCYEYVE